MTSLRGGGCGVAGKGVSVTGEDTIALTTSWAGSGMAPASGALRALTGAGAGRIDDGNEDVEHDDPRDHGHARSHHKRTGNPNDGS